MPMSLYFKRAKTFVQSDDNGTKKYLAMPGPSPQPVPFWVANTPTFKHGIKDGSIINLTPPEQMPGYKPAPVVVVEEPVEAEAEESKAEDDAEQTKAEESKAEDDAEQTEVPKAPFGAQPMTPVQSAPKVGNVRASSRRSK